MTQIIIAFFLCFLVSFISIAVSIFTLSILLIEIYSGAIWARMLGINLTVYSFIFLITLLLPLPIFIFTAFYLKPAIYATPYSETVHFGIFAFFAGFPFVLLIGFACCLIIRKVLLGKFNEKLARLTKAEPHIEILESRIVKRANRGSVLELSISIDKVLPIIPFYYFEARFLENELFVKKSDKKGNIGNLKVVRKDEKWIVQDIFTQEIISENPNLIIFQIRFAWLSKPFGKEFSTKVMFRLTAYNSVQKWTDQFYVKEFDIKFS